MQKSQKEMCADILKKLCEDVSADDRKEAVYELKVSIVTISTYLSGQVKDLDTAVRMIKFFHNRIKERDEFLRQCASEINNENVPAKVIPVLTEAQIKDLLDKRNEVIKKMIHQKSAKK